MPARFELTIRYWLNVSHVFRYVTVAILVSVQNQWRGEGGEGEAGERERERERTIKRRAGKEGKDVHARQRHRIYP